LEARSSLACDGVACKGCGAPITDVEHDDNGGRCSGCCEEPRVGRCGCREDEEACDDCRANGWFAAEEGGAL
jgi:hypothetical protein